jgi:hypothetical protein
VPSVYSDTWVWQPRGVPQSFKVESESARALVIFTPGGLERMFEGRRRARLVPAGIRPAATVSYDSETGLKAPNAADVQRRR